LEDSRHFVCYSHWIPCQIKVRQDKDLSLKDLYIQYITLEGITWIFARASSKSPVEFSVNFRNDTQEDSIGLIFSSGASFSTLPSSLLSSSSDLK